MITEYKIFETFNVKYDDFILIKKNNKYLIICDLFTNSKYSDERVVGVIYPFKKQTFTIYKDDISENEYQTDDNFFINIIEINKNFKFLKRKCDKLNKASKFNL
jgi:hypothetical protein